MAQNHFVFAFFFILPFQMKLIWCLFLLKFILFRRSRKRRPSYSQENDLYMGGFRDDEQMDECNAALVLMSLSGSPHSPRQWMLGSSPASNSSSSWISSGSDELSDENGVANTHQSSW